MGLGQIQVQTPDVLPGHPEQPHPWAAQIHIRRSGTGESRSFHPFQDLWPRLGPRRQRGTHGGNPPPCKSAGMGTWWQGSSSPPW